jgi:hypothetical protein
MLDSEKYPPTVVPAKAEEPFSVLDAVNVY